MDLFSQKLFMSFVANPYIPPKWVTDAGLKNIPTHKLTLGSYPTPLQSFKLPELEDLGIDCYIKRDDLTSCDLSGNKVRKLDFLLATALANQHDCIITPGGLQSNHARATAVSARQLGLDSYLILRKAINKDGSEDEIGLTGNLLFDRMVGANIVKVNPALYARLGSPALTAQLATQLREEGRNPYVIPVGGSDAIGVFGYVECIRELISQCDQSGEHYDHIVFGCGSGGTAAGIALSVRLSGMASQVHAVGVCDTPDIFYDHIQEVADHLGVDPAKFGNAREWCHMYQGQGLGYARSTSEELSFLIKVSTSTGIILDPVYSGKALFHFATHVLKQKPELFQKGQKVLFVHTGGTFGLYDKANELLPLLPPGKVTRLKMEDA